MAVIWVVIPQAVLRHIIEIIWNIAAFVRIESYCSDRRATCLEDKAETVIQSVPPMARITKDAKSMVGDQQFDTDSIGQRRHKSTFGARK
jgi:hypothetical protein